MHARGKMPTVLLIILAIVGSLVVGALTVSLTSPPIPVTVIDTPTTSDTVSISASPTERARVAMATATGSATPIIGTPTQPASPTAAPSPSSSSTPAASPRSATPTGTPESERTYVVRPGDDLIAIAEEFGVSVEALRERNGLTNDTLRTGRELVIPPPGGASQTAGLGDGEQVYVVQSGDFLLRIADQFGVPVEGLRERNELTNNNLQVGEELIIPASPTVTITPIS